MFDFGSKKKKNYTDKVTQKVDELNQVLKGQILSSSLEKNVHAMKTMFQDTDTLIIRHLKHSDQATVPYCIVYTDGLVNSVMINDYIVKPLMLMEVDTTKPGYIDTILNSVVMINEVKKTTSLDEIVKSVTYGDTILFAENCEHALILNTKGFQLRSPAEPESERILSGPRDGFGESVLINLSMIRRRLRTHDLKMRYYSVGDRTNTQTCICYIDSLVNKQLLKELYRRLDTIDIDAVLDSNYITELIKEERISPFRSTGYTERPDVVVAKLLEGRIAIFVDGTPVVITVPYLFIENFQSNEDYYVNYMYASFSRMLRMLGFVLTILVPGFYVAVVAYQHEMLPTSLLVSIAGERGSAPFPAAVEAFIVLITFEILRETGVRMPTNVGQALSIVGALVIGQAAVEAELVAAPMIIVVALTGITGLLVPKINEAQIFVRFALLALGSTLGMFGVAMGLFTVIIHLLNLTSLGISQITLNGDLKYQNVKDIAIRAPWWQMIMRPKVIATDRKRMKVNNVDKVN